MSANDFLLEKLGSLIPFPLFVRVEENIVNGYGGNEDSPLWNIQGIWEPMRERADRQEEPVLYEDAHQVLFACVKGDGRYILLGPVCLYRMDAVATHRLYRDYGIRGIEEKKIPVASIYQVLSALELLYFWVSGVQVTGEQILQANGMGIPEKVEMNSENPMLEMDREEYHHTYQEERMLLECVKEGLPKEAEQKAVELDLRMGTMSKDPVRQWYKVAICSITVATRAAMEGGISPAEAYKVSDRYLQRFDQCKSIQELVFCRNQGIRELAELVRRKKERKPLSNYVERTCDYIQKNYRKKIYLREIAGALGISDYYLSRLFSSEMGITMKEYILQVRVEHAANLLIYSDEPINKIAEYVNFAAQSHFGRVFKAHMNLTPRQYREQKKMKEFYESK